MAAATVNSIGGADLGGGAAWAGAPAATILIGSALAAPLWGRAFDRIGRRGGLAAGLAFGLVGSAIAGLALVLAPVPVLLLGVTLIGVSGAAVGVSRFAPREGHPPELRARA